jgi:hypothetical protein
MMKQLVRVGRAFPNRFFVAVSLLLCLSADGASAAAKGKPASTTDCTSASNKNIPPCALETGKITVFWPKRGLSNRLARAFNSKIEVWIDKANVGIVLGDTPVTVSVPAGPHKLELKVFDDYLENIRPVKAQDITVPAQKTAYFQIVDQSFAIVARELDAPTAQAVLAGGEPPKDNGSAAMSQAAPASPSQPVPASAVQAAVPGKEPKGKPNATASLAAAAGNDMRTPGGVGTIYLYWPRPASVLGFLDKYASDIPVYLDGRRVGGIKVGEYLALKASPGEHVLGLDVGLSYGRLLKKDLVLGAGATSHFHIENQDAVRMFEDMPDEAADNVKGLTQREAMAQ